MAYKFEFDKTATLKVPVCTDENGNIATGDTTVTGNTALTLKGLKKDATHAQTKNVLDAFIGRIADGKYNESAIEGSIKFKTVEEE